MEAPTTPGRTTSTPKGMATERSGNDETDSAEGGVDLAPEAPSIVQLIPVSPVPTILEEPQQEEEMRDRSPYSQSFNPDDLFAFPFPYVPPLSNEAIDKRLRATRAQVQSDAYQRLFRDLLRPERSSFEDSSVPCGSCPCCQRMLSYVSSLRTVLDHMVSDIVHKSPAGTRVAPCALCLQEHMEHVTHQEVLGSSQPHTERSSQQARRKSSDSTSSTQQVRAGAKNSRANRREQNIEDPRRPGHSDPQDQRRSQHEKHARGHLDGHRTRPGHAEAEQFSERKDGDDYGTTDMTGSQKLATSGGGASSQDYTQNYSTNDLQHTRHTTTESENGPGTPDEAQFTEEPGSTDQPSQEGRQDSRKQGTPLSPSRPPPLVLPPTQTRECEHEVPTTLEPRPVDLPLTRNTQDGPAVPTSDPEPDDPRWRQARAQLLEPPNLSPREDQSSVVIHGGQYIHTDSQDLLRPRNEAYVTIATDNLTALCCLVLGNSLRLTNTDRKLAVIVTDGVSGLLRHYLQLVFDVVQGVGVMDSQGSTKLALLEQPELGVSFTKLYVWSLDEFTKCVFLDSDTLVVQNCDELFDREELSAVPDIGWPDCFNSSVFVFAPSQETFWRLIHFAEQQDSFDGGDQGILNVFFRNWACDISRKLPFLYNLMANVSYTYKPAFKHFGSRVKIVHFFGSYKPWNVQFNPKTGQMAPGANVHPTYAQFVHFWLEIYTKRVLPVFSKEILDHMYSQDYACPHEVLQFIPSAVRQQDSLPTPPSFRVYSGDRPREQPSVVDSILQLARDIGDKPDEEAVGTDDNDQGSQEEPNDMPADPETIPGSEIDDYRNMAAWEQGRMDYMGQAKSDTIMKRLDYLIKGKR